MDFVFYDLETTGTSPAFDQPLQFAAILTDGDLREKDRREFKCRPAPHVVPSPAALLITGTTPEELADPARLTYLEFAQRVADLAEEWAPAIWTGYNSIRFDEEMLRQAFYQNLLPAVYATQFNGNTRFDVLTAMFAVHRRNPGLMEWPKAESGGITFRLDLLAPANGFAAHDAHDAVGDVEATLHVARKAASGDPALWSELLSNAHKKGVQDRLESFRPAELVTRFAGNDPEGCVGCFCGYSEDIATRAGFFDLDAMDPAELIDADDAALARAVEDVPRIVRTVTTNRAPALLEVREPSEEQLRRARLIADAPEFRRRVGRALAARGAREEGDAPLPVERQIYGEFYSNADKKLLQEFRRGDWPRRQEIVASLSDRRLRQLGRRLVAFYSPDLMTAEERATFSGWLRERRCAPDAPETEWTTVAKARADLAGMREGGEAEPAALDRIDAFLAGLAEEATE